MRAFKKKQQKPPKPINHLPNILLTLQVPEHIPGGVCVCAISRFHSFATPDCVKKRFLDWKEAGTSATFGVLLLLPDRLFWEQARCHCWL